MEENKNLEQAGATSAITEKKNESRKREASGKDNERMTADNAQEHRLNRAFQLLERVSEFCDKRQLYHTYNNKILWTRKNTVFCTRQGLKHLRSYSPLVRFNGYTEQQSMMTAGK